MQFFTRFFALAAAAAPFLANAAPVASRANDDIVPGKYIIQLKPETDIASIAAHHIKVRDIHARNLARRDDGADSAGKEREFSIGDFKAYAGSFDEATIEELKALPEVSKYEIAYHYAIETNAPQVLVVEPDFIMRTSAVVTRK
jgi:oryzin